MQLIVIIIIGSDWYSMNIDNYDTFQKDLTINSNNTYLTFQTSDFIRELKSRKIKNLPDIIDLESFDRQMSQEGKEFRKQSKWIALSFLRYHKIIDSEFKLTLENVSEFLIHISNLYKKLWNINNIEANRFKSIEQKTNKIIYDRQIKGIKVDLSLAKQRCKIIENEVYSIKNVLQLKYNIFTPDNYDTQKEYFKTNNKKVIRSFYYTFKVHSNNDPICKLFYELIRNQQDLDSLLYILSHWGGTSITYPSYFGFGSITSRITLRQPSLQNLRKSNRDIIIPENGKKLLYVDFSQFEAGILASMSNDQRLIELYNSDIYTDLANTVLGNKTKRDEAKIIFYRFMYGDDSLDQQIKKYFEAFGGLKNFKLKQNY